DGGDVVFLQLADDLDDRCEQDFLRLERGRTIQAPLERPVLGDETGGDLGPTEIDPDDACAGQGGGYPTSRMAPDDKPYRTYKGGRVKGKVPVSTATATKPRRVRGATSKPPVATGSNGGGAGWRSRVRMPRLRRPPWKRVILLGILVLLALVVVWGVT